ncbi:DUF2510 domain-containing protein [Microcella humidisoli]|uniref:DUF2510 domain-containing protein n=1 Tax=Microcella humidisoli TaxID=2963406 RepID=A0ABY5FUJ9_9MICO|nr:DUF2510 domain-containing protein [Microcella humidisoli]UTT61918.1 DUF2510 domain-containing protein [Microcella humidisoli]
MTDPAVPSTPAGWYADPAGGTQRRWWDGARWTDHLETPYSTTAAAMPERAPEGTDPSTTWIWPLVVIPVLQLLSVFWIDWETFIVTSLTDTSVAGQAALFSTPGYVAVTALGWITNILFVLFAFLDWRELRRRGVPQPFHWAWSFLVLASAWPVYPIGRAIVARRRTGRGMASLWITIATIVLGIIVTIGLAIFIVQFAFTNVDLTNLAP